MARANQSLSTVTNVRFADLCQKARLTEPELAKLSGLHVNTVKKILREGHVHPNSETKLERALTLHIADQARLSSENAVGLPQQKSSQSSLTARKRALLTGAAALEREAHDLAIDLAKVGETLAPSDLAQLRIHAQMLDTCIALLDGLSRR